MSALGPTEAQLEALRSGDPTERLALVRLLAVRDAGAWPAYLEALDGALKAAGGKRSYAGRVDGVLFGAVAGFDWLLIDEFPSRELTAESFRLANPHAAVALTGQVVLAVRPRALPRLALELARLAGRVLRRGPSHPKRPLVKAPPEDPAISPDAREVEAYLASAPDRPLCMLNLNRHRERARYAEPRPAASDVSGAAAYRRYGKNTLPHLLRRGGGPVFVARPLGVVVGEPSHPLCGPWDEILLVHYPRRERMLDMLTSTDYQGGLAHRSAGLERALLVPTTPA